MNLYFEFLILIQFCCLFLISGRNCLWPNEMLLVNHCLVSSDYPSVFSACYQEDGRLCISSDETSTWCTNSSHSNPSHAAFDSTGSFNFYDVDGEIYFTVYQSMGSPDDYFLIMQSNGNLVLYQYSKDSADVEDLYQCQDEGCQTIPCADCDPAPQCANRQSNDSSHAAFPLVVVLCIGLSIATLILISVIHRICYGAGEENKVEIDDLPTLATIEVRSRSSGKYDRVFVEVSNVDIINEDIESANAVITADSVEKSL